MKSKCSLVLSALFISGCAQVNDQFYSKKNFTSQTFVADMSECKRQNPFFVAIRGYVADSRDRNSYTDDTMVRECMKGKGYTVQLETR
jgi:PBP1b-binding outer membrane lipoprotein LpoB